MKRSGLFLIRALTVAALFVLLIGGCENSLGVSDTSASGIQGTVRIPGVDDSSGVLIVIERLTKGMTASVAKTLEPGGGAASKAVTEGLYSLYTDDSGRYQVLDLPEGEYTLTASKANTQGAVYKSISVEPKSVTVVDIVLTATGSVSGTVTLDRNNTGMVGTFIFAEGTSYIAAADDTGAFRIDNIPIGTYTIAFYHEGYTPSSVPGLAVAAGQTSVMGAVDLASGATGPYFVTYDANGATSGTVPVDTMNYLAGFRAIVKGNTGNLGKIDGHLIGWNTMSDGSGTGYSEDQTFVLGNSDCTLYAVWHPLTITYDANSATEGSVPVDTNVYSVGSAVPIRPNSSGLAQSGMFFAGWNTTADGSGTTYVPWADNPPIIYMGTTDITLYAKWSNSAVGTIGPAGGFVFVDKGYYSDGWRFMEMSPSDLSPGVRFSSTFFAVNTSIDIGTGLVNSEAIAAFNPNEFNAATGCLAYACNGYDDWFLPSLGELAYIKERLYSEGLGNLVGIDRYWSSTSTQDYTKAYCVIFESLLADSQRKDYLFNVRPVRMY